MTKGMTGKRKRRGKQPRPYWRWHEGESRWFHPGTFARLFLSGALGGLAGGLFGSSLAVILSKLLFRPSTLELLSSSTERALNIVDGFKTDILEMFN